MAAADFAEIVVPVSRSRALFRALLWGIPAFLLGAVSVMIYGSLNFVPSGVSNRVVDYAMGLAASPLPLAAAWSAWIALRWLALSVWGNPVEIVATSTTLTFCLGPFGKQTLNAADLEVRYPFELVDEEDEGGFESFLPEDEQLATLLPRIVAVGVKVPLQRTILQFAVGEEADIARTLRPAIEHWRSRYTSLA